MTITITEVLIRLPDGKDPSEVNDHLIAQTSAGIRFQVNGYCDDMLEHASPPVRDQNGALTVRIYEPSSDQLKRIRWILVDVHGAQILTPDVFVKPEPQPSSDN